MTRTQRILQRDNYRCAYCGGRAFQADHIVPVALRRRHPGFDTDDYLVASCPRDNWRKGTRRLVPPSWADRLHELPGTRPWAVWDGGPLPEVLR
jgi:5-methylcytosine-specific restriction endonuclease McrA